MTALLVENELVERFRNGDELSVRQLYNQFYRSLCYFAIRLISASDEAEDIALESFLKLLAKRQDFETLTDIRSFLFTVVRNACFDYLRRNKTKDRFAREQLVLQQTEEQFGQDEMLIAQTLQLIYAEIEMLPSQCKLVFKSIFFDCKTTAEVASELGLSRQTVLNQKTRAINLLRLKLYKHGFHSITFLLHTVLMNAAFHH